MEYGEAFGAQFRLVQDRTRDGQPVRVVVATRSYATDREDLWNAVTDAERLPRWFAPVTGKLEAGGRYQIEGNAGGSVLQCAPPETFELTWEFGPHVSWVRVTLQPDGAATRLNLEHLIPKDEGSEAHWKQYGPGATGVGWELGLLALDYHLSSGGQPIDPDKNQAWMTSDAGKAFMRTSAEAWGEAHVASGEDAGVAQAMARQTADFYTGA